MVKASVYLRFVAVVVAAVLRLELLPKLPAVDAYPARLDLDEPGTEGTARGFLVRQWQQG